MVFVPKKEDPAFSTNYRPITVASTLVRGFHKVLSWKVCRLIALVNRVFQSTDGCVDNVFLLNLILHYHHSCHKPLFVASVDVAKMFDTVSHRAIQTLRARSCPQPILEYVESVYSDALTTIVSDGWQSHAIHLRHGDKAEISYVSVHFQHGCGQTS
ncbi:hypothetical protein QLX08_005319 [Tetragonisca angustula]|uniref:Reverse transcriptase domain-containing protein n=1 Tax=Tetragonisca angustula TaxID=166442 RepID=A0AAW0ZYY8_9HYME